MQASVNRSLTASRPRLRFGVKTMMAAIVVCGLGCKFATDAVSYREERQGLEELRRIQAFSLVDLDNPVSPAALAGSPTIFL